MPCYSPIVGYYSADRGSTGKRAITFQRKFSISGTPLRLPCGQCIGCRLERSRQWALRCLHEKRMHKWSCFATLTYDNAHLPPGGTLVKRDLCLFLKRLRKEKGSGIRFYACGEYGDLNRRPHYHCLLFGCNFPDALQIGENGRGDKYYESRNLSELWRLGKTLLGDVSFDSAAYVARYVLKKVTGDNAKVAYEVMDLDGVVFDRLPEFTVMSRRPGIGAAYYEKYGSEVRSLDNLIVNGREVRPPRYYDTKSELLDPEQFLRNKARRRKMALLLKDDNTVDRRRVKEVLTLKLLKQKERSL